MEMFSLAELSGFFLSDSCLQHPYTHAILMGVGNKLPKVLGLAPPPELKPKLGNTSSPPSTLYSIPGLVVINNVVKRNKTTWPH